MIKFLDKKHNKNNMLELSNIRGYIILQIYKIIFNKEDK